MKKFIKSTHPITLLILLLFCVRHYYLEQYYSILGLVLFYIGLVSWTAFFKKEEPEDEPEDEATDVPQKTKIVFIKNGFNAYFKTSKKHKNKRVNKQHISYRK
jgi:hypothetical protein